MRLLVPVLLMLALPIMGCQKMRDAIQDGGGELQPGKTQQKFQGHVASCSRQSVPLPAILCPFHSDDGMEGMLVLSENVAVEIPHRERQLGNNEHINVLGHFDTPRAAQLLKTLDPNQTNQTLRREFILYVDHGADIQRLDFEPR